MPRFSLVPLLCFVAFVVLASAQNCMFDCDPSSINKVSSSLLLCSMNMNTSATITQEYAQTGLTAQCNNSPIIAKTYPLNSASCANLPNCATQGSYSPPENTLCLPYCSNSTIGQYLSQNSNGGVSNYKCDAHEGSTSLTYQQSQSLEISSSIFNFTSGQCSQLNMPPSSCPLDCSFSTMNAYLGDSADCTYTIVQGSPSAHIAGVGVWNGLSTSVMRLDDSCNMVTVGGTSGSFRPPSPNGYCVSECSASQVSQAASEFCSGLEFSSCTAQGDTILFECGPEQGVVTVSTILTSAGCDTIGIPTPTPAKKGMSGGDIAAAIIVPLLFIGIGAFVWFKYGFAIRAWWKTRSGFTSV